MPNCLENPDWKVRDFNSAILPNLIINICLKLNYCSPDQSRETSSSPTPGWRRCCPSTWERGSRPPGMITGDQDIFPYNQIILSSEEYKPPSSIYLLVASRASLVSCTSRSMTAGSLSANSLNLACWKLLDNLTTCLILFNDIPPIAVFLPRPSQDWQQPRTSTH